MNSLLKSEEDLTSFDEFMPLLRFLERFNFSIVLTTWMDPKKSCQLKLSTFQSYRHVAELLVKITYAVF